MKLIIENWNKYLEGALQEEIADAGEIIVMDALKNVFEDAGFDWILEPSSWNYSDEAAGAFDKITKALITLKDRSKSIEEWGRRIEDFFKASADPNGNPPGTLAGFGIDLKDDDGSDLIDWEEFQKSISWEYKENA